MPATTVTVTGGIAAVSVDVARGLTGEPGSEANVTTANVRAAGALMDDEVTNLAQVKAFASSDYDSAGSAAAAQAAAIAKDKDLTPTSAFRMTTLAASYCLTNNITDQSAARRIAHCLDIIDTAGLTSILADACFLRAGMQPSATAPKSLKGLTGTTFGTPVLTTEGMEFATSTKWAGWILSSPVTAFTLIADMQGVESGQTANGWISGVLNQSGVTTSAQVYNYNGTTTGLGYNRQGGTVTNTSAMTDNGDARIVAYYNPLPQIFAYSYDNAASPTITAWVDGVNVFTDSTGNTQSTSTLDRVLFGARHTTGSTYDIPYRGKVASWMLFSRVLTNDENITVAKAMRALDPRRMTFMTMGDSLTAQFVDSDKGINNWPCRAIRRNTRRNETVRLINGARNGSSSTYASTSYHSVIAPHIPAGYAADSGWLVCLYGTNDLLFSTDTSATIYSRIKAICALTKSASNRITTACFTVPPALPGGYTAPQETRRTDLNTLIRAGEEVDFDTLIDLAQIDAIESGYTGYWTDNLHPNSAGNRLIAAYVMARLAVGDVPANTVRPTITGTAAQGSTLTTSTGTWTDAVSYAYQWLANGTDIGGATSSTYVLQAGQVGLRVACRVTATNANGNSEITSQHTAIVS